MDGRLYIFIYMRPCGVYDVAVGVFLCMAPSSRADNICSPEEPLANAI